MAESRKDALALGPVLDALRTLCKWGLSDFSTAGDDLPFALVPFGSVRLLGRIEPGSDVDAQLVVAARSAETPESLRERLFSAFVTAIEGDQTDIPRSVSSVHVAGDATVPVVGFAMGVEEGGSTVCVDLSFSVVPPRIWGVFSHHHFGDALDATDDLVGEPEPLPTTCALTPMESRSLGSTNVHTLNGSLDSEALLREIGDRLPQFRRVLVVIKRWARSRGVYGSLGFLNGFVWSVMLASSLPSFAATDDNNRETGEGTSDDGALAAHFFARYHVWDWAQPVGVGIWGTLLRPNPRRDLICVATCSIPCKNACPQVSFGTRRTVKRELARAHDLFRTEEVGARTLDVGFVQNVLCKPETVFDEYGTFLRVTFSGLSPQEHAACAGWGRSRAMSLCYALERTSRNLQLRPSQIIAAPEDDASTGFPYSSMWFCGLKVVASREDAKAPKVDLGGAIAEFVAAFEAWPEKGDGMFLQVKRVKRRDVPAWVIDST
jgi:poly(A) polymerase Pap1